MELTNVHRHSADMPWARCLWELRNGIVPTDPSSVQLLAECFNRVLPLGEERPTRLMCHNKDVDDANNAELQCLAGACAVFRRHLRTHEIVT